MTNAQSRQLRDAHIYIILSPNHNLCYYGSTFNTLDYRFTEHKSLFATCTSKEIIKAGDAKIFELQFFPCHTKQQLEDREAHFILTDWEGCINERVPGAQRRAGGMKEYMKKINAKPETKAKKRAYAHKPEVKAKAKAYAHKPEVKAKSKAHNAKPEVKAHRNEKIACNICGCMISRRNISTHQKSNKCQKFIQIEQSDQ